MKWRFQWPNTRNPDLTKLVQKSHFKNWSSDYNKQQQQTREGGESDFQRGHIIILKVFNFQQKLQDMKETRRYDPYIGKKKLINCPGGSPDIGLARQKL